MYDDLGDISLIHFQLKSLILQLQELEKHRKAFQPGHWRLGVDILESADLLLFIIEIPGVRKEDISAEISNNVLVVRSWKKFPDIQNADRSYIAWNGILETFPARFLWTVTWTWMQQRLKLEMVNCTFIFRN